MAKRALVVAGGWDGHEPKQATERFLPFLKANGFEVIVRDSMAAYTDKALMDSLSLVVPCWTMGSFEGTQERGLLDAIASGVGIAGWHGGMGDSFRSNCDYQFMVGGQFVGHPGNIMPHKIHITDWDDPITAGIADFTLVSEQYYMHVDPSNKVLATSTFTGKDVAWIDGVVMPVVWKRRWNKGRVFYASFGHVAKDFDSVEARTIMERGMLWAAR
ncbi:MAG TPA: ThuA domain-containing protein [Planctomycetota bacterium]|nr:ThuA domain-containing protein [Planctomycetota bacterium]